jgi:hypothetical protein
MSIRSHIALLRGLDVGGNVLKMDVLRGLCTESGVRQIKLANSRIKKLLGVRATPRN